MAETLIYKVCFCCGQAHTEKGLYCPRCFAMVHANRVKLVLTVIINAAMRIGYIRETYDDFS